MKTALNLYFQKKKLNRSSPEMAVPFIKQLESRELRGTRISFPRPALNRHQAQILHEIIFVSIDHDVLYLNNMGVGINTIVHIGMDLKYVSEITMRDYVYKYPLYANHLFYGNCYLKHQLEELNLTGEKMEKIIESAIVHGKQRNQRSYWHAFEKKESENITTMQLKKTTIDIPYAKLNEHQCHILEEIISTSVDFDVIYLKGLGVHMNTILDIGAELKHVLVMKIRSYTQP